MRHALDVRFVKLRFFPLGRELERPGAAADFIEPLHQFASEQYEMLDVRVRVLDELVREAGAPTSWCGHGPF